MKHILGPNSRSRLTQVREGDSQPNAVDLRLDKVFRIHSSDFVISNESKTHRLTTVIQPDEEDWYHLDVGTYEVVMENIISIGPGEAGWVITRSTLNRNGVFLTSGLYDTGYHGVMAGCMHVEVGPVHIKKGTRIGQYLSFDAESLSFYSGSYGLDSTGKAKQDEQKYHE